MEKNSSFIEIVQSYLNSDKAVLPVFSQTGLRVSQEVAKEDPDLRTIETLISSDQALTTQVLRTANSAFFKGLSKANSIREAIIRLGTNEVGNIVTLCTQQMNYRSLDPFFFDMLKRLWQHSVGCAIGSQWVARQLKFDALATEAFTAGLLHDVGKLLIIKVPSYRTGGAVEPEMEPPGCLRSCHSQPSRAGDEFRRHSDDSGASGQQSLQHDGDRP